MSILSKPADVAILGGGPRADVRCLVRSGAARVVLVKKGTCRWDSPQQG